MDAMITNRLHGKNDRIKVDQNGLFLRWFEFDPPKPGTSQARLHSMTTSQSGLAEIAWTGIRAYVAGFVSLDFAVEVTHKAASFFQSMSDSGEGCHSHRESKRIALVWLTATIARQILARQERPGSFTPRRHFEVWNSIANARSSCKALHNRLRVAEETYQAFAGLSAKIA